MNKRSYYIILAILMICITVATVAVNYYEDTNKNTEDIILEYDDREGDYEPFVTIDKSDIELLAKTVYGEARGCSTIEQSAVIWCILNRVDAGGGTIKNVVTAPYQFTGYDSKHPVTDEFASLAEDVLARWILEKHCVGEVGRTLPIEYQWFTGNGKENIFRDQYDGNYTIWDWDCYNPYLTIQD